MVPHSAALDALLATRAFNRFELFSFTGGNLNSNVLRFCAGDRDLTVNGALYSSGANGGPYFNRKDNKAKVRQATGLQVAQLVFDVDPGNATLFGVPWRQAVRASLFDGADCTLERCFTPLSNWADTSRGAFRRFVGRVGPITISRTLITFTINAHSVLLNQMLPRNLFQAGCVNALYDPACGVNPASYALSATVNIAGSTAMHIVTTSLAQQQLDYFVAGKIAFTSGNNAGLARTIQAGGFLPASGVYAFNLLAPFPGAPAIGDAFTIYPGCDLSDGVNGCAKFGNNDRYKGFKYIPQPDTAV